MQQLQSGLSPRGPQGWETAGKGRWAAQGTGTWLAQPEPAEPKTGGSLAVGRGRAGIPAGCRSGGIKAGSAQPWAVPDTWGGGGWGAIKGPGSRRAAALSRQPREAARGPRQEDERGWPRARPGPRPRPAPRLPRRSLQPLPRARPGRAPRREPRPGGAPAEEANHVQPGAAVRAGAGLRRPALPGHRHPRAPGRAHAAPRGQDPGLVPEPPRSQDQEREAGAARRQEGSGPQTAPLPPAAAPRPRGQKPAAAGAQPARRLPPAVPGPGAAEPGLRFPGAAAVGGEPPAPPAPAQPGRSPAASGQPQPGSGAGSGAGGGRGALLLGRVPRPDLPRVHLRPHLQRGHRHQPGGALGLAPAGGCPRGCCGAALRPGPSSSCGVWYGAAGGRRCWALCWARPSDPRCQLGPAAHGHGGRPGWRGQGGDAATPGKGPELCLLPSPRPLRTTASGQQSLAWTAVGPRVAGLPQDMKG